MVFPDEAAFQAYLQDVKAFLWQEIDPLVPQIERDELIPFEQLRPKFRDHHLFDCLVPEAYGGLGLSTVQYAAVLKELAKIHGGIRAMLHVHNSSVHMIETGRPEQQARYLPAMATGDLLVCFGLTEPDSGSGLDSNCTAIRKGDAYILNGRKHLITNAREADLFAIFCFTSNPALNAERQFSVLLVERGMPGFTITPMAHTMGCSGASHDLLTFEDVAVPVDNVLGQEGMGPEQLLAFLEVSRVFIAVAALGTAERSLELSTGVGQTTRHLRQAHRQPPGRAGLFGRNGHGHLRPAPHDPRRPAQVRRRPANCGRVIHVQAFRPGSGRAGHRQGTPGARRTGLPEVQPHRNALP